MLVKEALLVPVVVEVVVQTVLLELQVKTEPLVVLV
jgi:hypothetical protein